MRNIKIMLYCDLSTMSCCADDIDNELSSFARSFLRANNSLWFFECSNEFNGSFLPTEENIFYDNFEKYTNEDSIIYLDVVQKQSFYNLPDNVSEFLQED